MKNQAKFIVYTTENRIYVTTPALEKKFLKERVDYWGERAPIDEWDREEMTASDQNAIRIGSRTMWE